ncbi:MULTISPECIES: DUF1822 family protein [Calothrix]|uniref:DUF1822 family protein n=2 Tax=Calothrix TaxID=1186 RepID=A0ABR8A2M9_9CYAN|nr:MULTISPECIES: DUF1822 family protein [Calothrix]MBD2194120.1 DUF1822 family protein [Calothrix parietina FACHB-288]MBD2227527.1 DUF1822 family protein [Calothrix anomala FACHB-343]
MRRPYPALPQPGEIWELSRQVLSPIKFSPNEENNLYSSEAQNFLQGNAPPRYVMIVTEPETEPELDNETETEWNIVSVMVLSVEISFISDVDLLIPAHISGLTQDLLAETWNVQLMLACNLLQPVGKRVSHEIYDILLTIGDCDRGLVNQPPEISQIELLGLKSANKKALETPEIALFHRQEQAWNDVLTIPLAAYHTYLKSLKFTNQILNEQLQIEQELPELESIPNRVLQLVSASLSKTQTVLSDWWRNIFDLEWQVVSTVPNFAIATRSNTDLQNTPANPDEIAAIINQLSVENDESLRQRAAKRLGEIAVGNSDAIQALVCLLRSTSDDETLWTAVESLRKIDPENPAAGVKRVKVIDLGMQIAGKTVALAVALLQKLDGDISVLLQVYPTGNDDYLPPDLKLILLDDSGEILHEVIARRADIYIQLKFSCQPGEKFSVQVALGEANITEDFVI